MKFGVKVGVAAVGVLVVLSLVPLDRTNPPVTGDIQAPTEVKAILQRSCYDCHSNETRWPWYAYVAPINFLVKRDVSQGRKHLNFSEWGSYQPERKAKKQRECGEEVAEGEMPPAIYLPMHPEAKLSDADRQVLTAWANGPVTE
jgi:cytochrome c551/c552